MKNNKLPIGYWLKKADDLLTKGIDKIQSEFGLNRTEWQVLNSIAGDEKITLKKLSELLKPFAGEEKITEILSRLLASNLIEGTASYSLTLPGKQLHADCLQKQNEFRKFAMNKISEEQYEVTINTLAQLVSNLSEK